MLQALTKITLLGMYIVIYVIYTCTSTCSVAGEIAGNSVLTDSVELKSNCTECSMR